VLNDQKCPKRIPCPVCFSDQAQRLWGTTSGQAAQHFVLREKSLERHLELRLHIESLWGQATCDILRCDTCGFCFSSPYIAGDEQFYSLAYDRCRYPVWKWEFQLTYDALRTVCRPDMKLLEIGAGHGAFLAKIADTLLPRENLFGTEFSITGRSRLETLGVKCFSQDVRRLSGTDFEQSFDCVCLFQVLEHMDGLDVLFEKLNGLMKNGGSLFIAVPNPRIIEFNESHGALLDMPPAHIGRWNRECFERIGKRHGFQIVDFRTEKPGFMAMAKVYAQYRFLRKSQRNGSFENRIQTIQKPILKKVMQLIGVALTSLFAIPNIARLNNDLGSSLWVHLKKCGKEGA